MLELKQLSRHFGGVRAVDGLELTVDKGQIFGLIGPNGSGKSTTVNLVTGLFAPTSGRILFDGADIAQLLAVLKDCPDHVTAHLFYPGYSTSVRHGGIYAARDGGALRATLTMLANTPYVAYLDDDNWWAPAHLCALRTAIEGRAWAFSLRYFAHARSRKMVCIDEWESLGPGKGAYAERFGGFVDPNCLMIDKLACWDCIALWNIPLVGDDKGMSADRNIYNFLQHHSVPGSSGEASVYYVLDENEIMHPQRLKVMGARYQLAAK